MLQLWFWQMQIEQHSTDNQIILVNEYWLYVHCSLSNTMGHFALLSIVHEIYWEW